MVLAVGYLAPHRNPAQGEILGKHILNIRIHL